MFFFPIKIFYCSGTNTLLTAGYFYILFLLPETVCVLWKVREEIRPGATFDFNLKMTHVAYDKSREKIREWRLYRWMAKKIKCFNIAVFFFFTCSS